MVIDLFGRSIDSKNIRFIYADETRFIPASIALLKSSSHPINSQTFVRFLLSKQGQKLLQSQPISRLSIDPDLYDSVNQPFNPFSIAPSNTAKAFDAKLSVNRSISRSGNEATFFDGHGIKMSLGDSDVEGSKLVIFRPQSISLTQYYEGSSQIKSHIQKREFLGNLIRYEVDVGQQHLLIDEVYGQDNKPAEIGTTVGLSIDHDHIIVMDT